MRLKNFQIINVFLIVAIVSIFFDLNKVTTQSYNVEATIQISVCGNAVQEGGEQCDSSDLGGDTCTTIGFGSGVLSCDISCSFDDSECIEAPPTASYGGGSPSYTQPIVVPTGGIILKGIAYPRSSVTILRDGVKAVSIKADNKGLFTADISNLSPGSYTFGLYAEDLNLRRSSIFNFIEYIEQGGKKTKTGILLAPTIDIDKIAIKQGDVLSFFGYAATDTKIKININSEPEQIINGVSDIEGFYKIIFDTSFLSFGSYKGISSFVKESESPESLPMSFEIGEKTIFKKEEEKITINEKASDINGDTYVNLVDFSIVAFWYERSNPPASVDLNGDGKVNLVDFSIMAYYWTG